VRLPPYIQFGFGDDPVSAHEVVYGTNYGSFIFCEIRWVALVVFPFSSSYCLLSYCVHTRESDVIR
jgi:hypothetical protein